MKAPSWSQRWLQLAALFTGPGLLTATESCATKDDAVECPSIGCSNTVTLTGKVAAAKTGQRVEAKYCSAEQCVEGLLTLAPPGRTACTDGDVTSPDAGVCLSLQTDGTLEVAARVTRANPGMPPKNGEVYTLELVDADSGSVLVEEARQADYTTLEHYGCPACWSITIEL